MKSEFMIAITQLAAEKNLPQEVVLEAMEAALVSAYKKDSEMTGDIVVIIDRETGEHNVYRQHTVVQEVEDPEIETAIQDARKVKPDAQIGDHLRDEVHPGAAGRIAAQTAKQVVLQKLREAEREMVFEEFSSRASDIVTGVIQRIEPKHIVVDLGKTEAIFPGPEQVRNENYRSGQRLKFYLLEVHRSIKGPQLVLSRTHKNLLKRLFELEVPEIYRGTVEIKSIAREAGYRSKVAVSARQEGVDAVGSCVGLRGIRIQNIVNELNGERIDVIQWDSEPQKFVANALSPAQVLTVRTHEEENTASVIVPDRQLSLAIGKEGQNARLAAKLTGWRIDIKPESAMSEEMAAEVAAEVEAAAVEAAARPAPAPAPAAEVAVRTEAPEPWMEVVESEAGAATPAAPATPTAEPVAAQAQPAAPSGLRFAEDLGAPKVEEEDPRKKKAKTTKGRDEEPVRAKKAGKKGRRVAIIEEDEEDYDFEFGLEDFGYKDDEEDGTEEATEEEASE
ncbi:MAG TPA: transcription termination factor NusA [Dehalococcoidia bacterium]|nr:transcription termination factor NusA [Dehalococcoidia bacterium]